MTILQGSKHCTSRTGPERSEGSNTRRHERYGMKKLTMTLCLMLLSMAVLSSPLYAAFIIDLDRFEVDNTVAGTNTFTDDMDNGVEPTGPVYGVDPGFGSTREGGGLLELNSEDTGPVEDGEIFLEAAVADSDFFFSSGGGGYVEAKFEVNDGDFADSFFGIGILNFLTGFQDPATDDEVFMGVFFGSRFAIWGDEDDDFFEDISVDWTSSLITMRLEVDASNNVMARWDFGSNDIFELEKSLTLSLNINETGEFYAGGFEAGQIVPEPSSLLLSALGFVCVMAYAWWRDNRVSKLASR